MASSVVDRLVGIIASALQKETSLLIGVHDELNNLKDELVSMKSFLKDADTKQLRSEGNYTWVASVRDLAYLSEDIIDEFLHNLHKQKRSSHFNRYLNSGICIPKYLWENHQIAMKLQDVKKRLKAIHERKQQYDIDPREGSSDVHDIPLCQSHSSFFIKEDDVIGLKHESEQFKRWLIDEGELRQTVISIVGMGGSGKTTLVTNAYNCEAIKRCFDCYAWVTVSQTYKRENLFRSLIKEFHQSRKELVPELASMDFRNLVNMLISYLEQKRYLVVLDDVWDTNVWDTIRVAFPQNELGSRVMITTRNEEVGSFSPGVKNHILHIKPLKDTEAWELFCRKAFASYPDRSCPKELHKTAWELVGKCQGLPLAIVTIGGLMSSKKSIIEWTTVCNSLNWQLSKNPRLEAIKHILLLSYIDLPYPLKHCFLHCCLFPEDYRIKRKRLIRLWVAEGLVQQDSRAKPRQVAESYLMELIHRNMVQVVERNEFGRPKACKMHDLLREIALSISEKENFCTVHDGRTTAGRSTTVRRISIQSEYGDYESYEGFPQTRSFFVFTEVSKPTTTTLLSRKLKLVRILDLEDSLIDKLPDRIGNLFNLRYLNLRRTKIAELPTSIKKLYNLEVLDLRDTLIKELPKGIEELENLKHLTSYRYNYDKILDFQRMNGHRALFKLKKLKKLEVMSMVEAEGEVVRQLGMMTLLTKMGISNLRQLDEIELCSSIQNLKKLQSLFLMASREDELLAVDALELPPPYLRSLGMVGKLERVPQWFRSLESLTSLSLHWSRMQEDPLSDIAELPNLGRLILTNAYVGRELHFSKGFAKLRKLYLFNFPYLSIIRIEKEVMPHVHLMLLNTCTSLTALPQGIEFLTHLGTLGLPTSLGNERFKVQRVPNVYIW